MPFLDSLDIANRALQHCGSTQIASATEDSKNNTEASFAYDKVRRAELRRNVWRFAVRKAVLRPIDSTTLLMQAPLFDSTAIYNDGAVVRDANGRFWSSLIPNNMDNEPGGNNEAWDAYFGPLAAMLWSSSTPYYAGEIVYKAGAVAGSYQVYRSLKNANSDDPSVALAWSVSTTYYAGQAVSYSGSQWRSLIPFNLGITPADGPLDWDTDSDYVVSDTVTGSDHFIYTSLGTNTGIDPVTDDGTHWTKSTTVNAWSRTPMVAVSATSWVPIGVTSLTPLSMLYPIGAGPTDDASSRNACRLPAGYLREAPQDPKAGSNSTLGATTGLAYNDWLFEGDFLVTRDSGPITFRFVADVTVVRQMDDMFCEGLACRVAAAICESVTQSTAKLQTIASEYKLFMGEARAVNAIEEGSEEPPVDDYISCRA